MQHRERTFTHSSGTLTAILDLQAVAIRKDMRAKRKLIFAYNIRYFTPGATMASNKENYSIQGSKIRRDPYVNPYGK